jgi:selenocysteine lyase/cysteine desulfurase
MQATPAPLTPEYLRSQIIGADACIDTPFGRRSLLYADYTASGRALAFVESHLAQLLALYANTHTEDDTTGRTMTGLLHQAETRIKQHVNAGNGGRVIGIGSGATGAIQKMQQIIGVALVPATRAHLDTLIARHFGARGARSFRDFCRAHQPVVFVGPYEHHSNEVSWRESLATVIEVRLDAEGGVDLEHLESLLLMPEYRDRLRIGSFSAASNVTGLKTPVHDVAVLLHRHQALAFFDYAASAPYVSIDMNPPAVPGEDPSMDALFISPHKFLGGPGASGILVFNERCYRGNLAPTFGGGGTVDFVGPRDHVFIGDIETREKAGTPGILQIIRAAMVFQIKDAVGEAVIEARESRFVERAMQCWGQEDNIEILGNPDPARRVGIVSFNIRDGVDNFLHPRFVTTLLNDLFGIQSRAGCSCAGPYGHALLNIDHETATRYRSLIVDGMEGIKPGWCRVGFHYVFDDAEVDHLIACVTFVARHGRNFLPLYHFDLATGAWTHRDTVAASTPELDDLLSGQFACADSKPDSEARRAAYAAALAQAGSWLSRLPRPTDDMRIELDSEAGQLQYFTLLAENVERRDHARAQEFGENREHEEDSHVHREAG